MSLEAIGIVILIVLLSVFLLGATYTSVQLAGIEETATEEAERILESPAYDELELMNVELVMMGEDIPFEHGYLLDAAEGIERIVIEIGHPPGETYPDLAGSLDATINEELDHEVTVQIRFVSIDNG